MRRIFGEEARTRRAAKKEDRLRARAALHDPNRLTDEERWALMNIAPSEEAVRTGLPLWPGITEIATYPHEMQVAADSSGSFLRRVRLSRPHSSSENLRGLLEIGNRELERVANACGAVVVGHEYGLYDNRVAQRFPSDYNDSLGFHSDLIPRGFILGAIVDSIRSTQPLTADQEDAIERGVQTYSSITSPYKLVDNAACQFTYGLVGGDTIPQLRLHDIDLRFA